MVIVFHKRPALGRPTPAPHGETELFRVRRSGTAVRPFRPPFRGARPAFGRRSGRRFGRPAAVGRRFAVSAAVGRRSRPAGPVLSAVCQHVRPAPVESLRKKRAPGIPAPNAQLTKKYA